MNDSLFQEWSELLTTLRSERQAAIEIRMQDSTFDAHAFFGASFESLSQIMERWFALEKQSWDMAPPEDVPKELGTLRTEMASAFDFELESIRRELAQVRSDVNWSDTAVTEAQSEFNTLVEDLRRKYQIKINGLSGKKKLSTETESYTREDSSSSRARSRGLTWVSLILGVAIGAAPAVYFWKLNETTQKQLAEEKSKMLSDQQTMVTNLAGVSDVFSQLANGKMLNLPQLEKRIQEISGDYDAQRKTIQSTYTRNQTRIKQKYGRGERYESAIQEAQADRDRQLNDLKGKEEKELSLLLQQKESIKALLAR